MDIFKDFPNFFKKIQDIKISFPQIGGGMGYEVWGLGGWGVENLGNGLWAKGDRNKAFITLKKKLYENSEELLILLNLWGTYLNLAISFFYTLMLKFAFHQLL